MFSTYIQGARAYQGDDMTDEDFAAYAQAHHDQLMNLRGFVIEHKEALSRGMLGGVVGRALKNVVTKYPTVGGVILAGGVELVKELYMESAANSKEERFSEMEKELSELKSQMDSLRDSFAEKLEIIHAGEERLVENYNTENLKVLKKQQHIEAMQKEYGYWDESTKLAFRMRFRDADGNIRWEHTYVISEKYCGPHRDSYQFYRSSDTSHIRNTVDRIYHDSVNPRSEYVTKDRYESSSTSSTDGDSTSRASKIQ